MLRYLLAAIGGGIASALFVASAATSITLESQRADDVRAEVQRLYAEALPNRNVAVARELTKLHEELRPGLPHGLIAYYEAHPPKGEIVLLVGPPPERVASPEYAEQLLADALRTLKPSQAAGQVAKATGLDRKELYARALELRSE